jgi:hypothetical protein
MMKSQKNCFGILDNVFPMGEEGLREIVPACFECPDRTECLRHALKTEQGLVFKSEIVDRTPARGLVARLKRWSEKKDLSRRLKQKKG